MNSESIVIRSQRAILVMTNDVPRATGTVAPHHRKIFPIIFGSLNEFSSLTLSGVDSALLVYSVSSLYAVLKQLVFAAKTSPSRDPTVQWVVERGMPRIVPILMTNAVAN